jgi:hypothetical protein
MSLGHPPWCCSSEYLNAHRIHLSRPSVAHSAGGDLTVSVQLVQRGDDDAPVINMVAAFSDYGPGNPAEEYLIGLDAQFARTVGWLLLAAGRQAGHGPDRSARR